LPTLPAFTASPADRAAPEKLAYQEIKGSGVDCERRETGPCVRRARICPPGLLPARVMCSVYISPRNAQSCTNEKSRTAPRPRITLTNHDYLEGNGFASENCPQSAAICVHLRRLVTGNETGPRSTSCVPRKISSCDACTKMHKPKTAALAVPRITKGKDSHLSKIGFLLQKNPPPPEIAPDAPVGRTDLKGCGGQT
jgi:hypothetical protein